jgi:uncharacterized Zn finger protein
MTEEKDTTGTGNTVKSLPCPQCGTPNMEAIQWKPGRYGSAIAVHRCRSCGHKELAEGLKS